MLYLMSPLERAARALAKAESGEDCFDDFDEDFQETFMAAARAVLEAVRDPSKTMCEVGANRLRDPDKGPRATAQDVWREMINAAVEGQ
jgi:hypothetical protein